MTPESSAEIDNRTQCRIKQLVYDTIQSGELQSIPGVKMVRYQETSLSPCYVEIEGFPEEGILGAGIAARRGRPRVSAATGLAAAGGMLTIAFGAVFMLRKRRSTSASRTLSTPAEAALWVESRIEV